MAKLGLKSETRRPNGIKLYHPSWTSSTKRNRQCCELYESIQLFSNINNNINNIIIKIRKESFTTTKRNLATKKKVIWANVILRTKKDNVWARPKLYLKIIILLNWYPIFLVEVVCFQKWGQSTMLIQFLNSFNNYNKFRKIIIEVLAKTNLLENL